MDYIPPPLRTFWGLSALGVLTCIALVPACSVSSPTVENSGRHESTASCQQEAFEGTFWDGLADNDVASLSALFDVPVTIQPLSATTTTRLTVHGTFNPAKLYDVL